MILFSRNFHENETLAKISEFTVFFFFLFFFPQKHCPDGFSLTTGRIVLKYGTMVDKDVELCDKVLKVKMLDSKAGPWAFPKPPKFCQDYFFLSSERSVLKCFDMIHIFIWFCRKV